MSKCTPSFLGSGGAAAATSPAAGGFGAGVNAGLTAALTRAVFGAGWSVRLEITGRAGGGSVPTSIGWCLDFA